MFTNINVVTKILIISQDLYVNKCYVYVVIMYVDVCKSKMGIKKYSRALIRESYRENGRVKKRTIANISNCSDEEIRAIKLALHHKGNLVDAVISLGEIHSKQGLSIGAVFVLYQIARRLDFVKVLGNSEEARRVLWMVIARVIEPGSRLANVRLAQYHAAVDVLGMDGFNEDDLYDAMDWVYARQNRIEDTLFKRRCADMSCSDLFLYDVSSSYLEGTKNELAAFGYNRDKKKGKMQIVFGLLTDKNGWPVSIECFKGNTRDPCTFESQIKKLKNRFGCERVTMVGDRGMIKSGQIEDLNSDVFHYITAITEPEIKTLLKQNVIQMELFTEKLCEVEHDDVRYILRKNPVRAKDLKETRDSKIRKVKELLDEKNQYLTDHLRAQPSVAKRNVNELIEKLKITNLLKVRYEGRTVLLETNEVLLEQSSLLDGCYVIKSDIPMSHMEKESIHQRYKDLAFVETAFRDMKTNLLNIRPINVRKANRTRAHFFIGMLSYMISKYLREKWKDIDVTIGEGVHELSTICCIETSVGAVRYNQIPQPRETAEELISSLEIKLPEILPCNKINVATRKKLNQKRKN